MVDTLGTARNELVYEHRRQIEKIINKNKKKDNYYILVHTMNNPFTRNIHDKYILTSMMPERILGTILYYVDNKKGLLKRIWCLPLDRTNVIPEAILDKEHTVTMAEFTAEKTMS